ncbi:MAG: teichoic acid transporter, partial [Eggerthellaceae bacterium]|nr:teichoic acid transporter [Eggerthellaceae bacterium]
LDDDTINSTLNANSYTLLDWNSLGTGSGTNIDLIKLPDGVTIIDAGIDYSNGISSLSSSEAARLLNGSWEFTVVRGNSIDMRVKYADFTSGTLDAAIQNAIDQQGLSGTPLGEAGVDAAGNSYQTGSVNVNGTAYNWQVSACVLTDAYSVSGLPADAMYVGIRLYL